MPYTTTDGLANVMGQALEQFFLTFGQKFFKNKVALLYENDFNEYKIF